MLLNYPNLKQNVHDATYERNPLPSEDLMLIVEQAQGDLFLGLESHTVYLHQIDGDAWWRLVLRKD